MKHIFTLMVALAGAQAAMADAPAGYALVWADEFDHDGLPDLARWVYDTEANATGWYNNELQYYAVANLANSAISDGQLHITARKERLSAADYGGQNYSSARLITHGIQDWTYGYFEISARLPCGKGTWPAFWLLGPDAMGYPDMGEIDLMEQVGSDPTAITSTIHTKATEGTYGIGDAVTLAGACDALHLYRMTWTPSEITTSVDDTPILTFRNDGKGVASWPFDQPHYLLINLAIGGDMAGAVDDSIFPVTLDVDYIRVYQKAP